MKPIMQKRQFVLGTALTFSLLATGWVMSREQPEEDIKVVKFREPRTKDPRPKTFTDAGEEIKLALLGRDSRLETMKVSDVFKQQSWYVPPPPRPVQQQAPVAPPLPFVYFGKMLDGDREIVFLSRQDKSYAVKTGDVIDNSYRVDEIKPSLITFTYLPLSQKQSMSTGSMN